MKQLNIFILLLLFASCQKNPNSINSEAFTVSGKVLDSDGAVRNATVSIDDVLNWTTKTSDSGEFEINNVSKGNHNILAKKTNEDKSFVENVYTLEVYEDITLNELLLPKRVLISDPSNVTTSSLSLSWQSSDADDFYEYKLYRKESPGLDQNTGELIYVSTFRDDTTFVDTNLLSNQTYYYRVYIMNQYGRMGGSNIVFAQTEIGNLIPDVGFESASSIIDYWNIRRGSGSGYTTILDDNIKVEGLSSLFNVNPKSYTAGALNTLTILETNTPINLIPNTTYELACWMRAEGEITDIGGLIVGIGILNGQKFITDLRIDTESQGNMGDSVFVDWTYRSSTFFTTSNEPVRIQIYITNESFWIDDLYLGPTN